MVNFAEKIKNVEKMEIELRVKKVMPTETRVGGKEMVIYNVVGETVEGHVHEVMVTIYGKEKFESYGIEVGNTYGFGINIESRPWKETYITRVNVWRCYRTRGK